MKEHTYKYRHEAPLKGESLNGFQASFIIQLTLLTLILVCIQDELNRSGITPEEDMVETLVS